MAKRAAQEKIRRWMEKEGLSVTAAAGKVGIARATFNKVRTGKTPCLYHHARKIAPVMGVHWESLVEDRGSAKKMHQQRDESSADQ